MNAYYAGRSCYLLALDVLVEQNRRDAKGKKRGKNAASDLALIKMADEKEKQGVHTERAGKARKEVLRARRRAEGITIARSTQQKMGRGRGYLADSSRWLVRWESGERVPLQDDRPRVGRCKGQRARKEVVAVWFERVA